MSARRILAAFLAAAAVVFIAVVAMAQPTIAEMKVKVYETWIEFVYDVNPGTSGDVIVQTLDGAGTRVTLNGDVRICDPAVGCATPSVATANGDLHVNGALEVEGTFDSGDVRFGGAAGAADFSSSGASSILVADNDTTALLIGSTGQLNLLTFDTGDDAETVVVTGTTATDAFHVATGEALFAEAVDITGDATLNGGASALTVNGTIERGPWFNISFNEGAAKGVSLYSQLSAAYSTTADAVNILAYGQQHRFNFVTNTTATGTITPAGTALGLDLNAGAPGNSDEWTLTAGQGTANVGGMIIPGTTPAWAACATFDVTTVAEAAGLWLLVTTPGAHVDLSSADPNYTSYAGIGIEQTDIVVSDNTDGAVDTTIDAVDATPVTLCIRGSSSSVITYYVDGVNRAAAATHTLGDGVPHVVRIQGLNHTGTEAPMQVSSFSLLPQ